MPDILTYKQGRAGRITLTRPQALNALSYDMCLKIEAALDAWHDDDEVAVVVIDAQGERAFCSGGDIQELYDRGRAGDFAYGRRFWADEYRLNAKIAEYPKPYVAFMQGFTMGGGVGVAAHGSHRVVCETTQIAMPEAGIGLIPDVGGTLLLARAPGRLGEYLGTTAARMGPADAIFAGFADVFIPQEFWLDAMTRLETTGDISILADMAEAPPEGLLTTLKPEIDDYFAGSPAAIAAALEASETDFAKKSLAALRRNSPLSVVATLELVRRARGTESIRAALAQEYRFTWRAAEQGDLLEGIRAAIVDKDRNPKWKHARLEEVGEAEIAAMLADLGPEELNI